MKKQKSQAVLIRKTHLLRRDEYVCSVYGHSENKPFKVCPSCGSQIKKNKYDPSWVDEAEMIDIIFGG